MSRRMLILDDEPLFRETLADVFSGRGFLVSLASSLAAARQLLHRMPFDIVLLDNKLPDGGGLALVPELLRSNDAVKILLLTAFPSYENAVQALKSGIHDYLSKPVEIEEVILAVERLLHTTALEKVEEVHRFQAHQESRTALLVGAGARFAEIHRLIERAAATEVRVLITGETGTGKSLVAKAIHYASRLAEKPFISVNCAALPESLIEAELFGVEKGAFTGATATRKGLFELADGGTLFLDEVAEMPLALQAKLLGVLEEQTIRRLGSEVQRTVSVRVLAATNVDPERAVAAGTFRRDLYYRLNVIHIHLPPLRERLDDLPALCRHFIATLAPGRAVDIPEDEIARLAEYAFPGNVRELRNLIERSLILHDGQYIFPSRLIFNPAAASQPYPSEPLQRLADVERQHILAVFERCGHNLTATAQALDISLSTLRRKLTEYGVRPTAAASPANLEAPLSK